MPPALTRRILGLPRLQAAAELGGPMHFPFHRIGQGPGSFPATPGPHWSLSTRRVEPYWPREALKGDVDRTWASLAQVGYGLGLTTSLTSGPYYTGRANTCGPCAVSPQAQEES